MKGLEKFGTLPGSEDDIVLRVWGCENLESLDGLENMFYARGITIGNPLPDSMNLALADFCAIQNYLSNGFYLPAAISIDGNLYNPTIQDIINGDCSL